MKNAPLSRYTDKTEKALFQGAGLCLRELFVCRAARVKQLVETINAHYKKQRLAELRPAARTRPAFRLSPGKTVALIFLL